MESALVTSVNEFVFKREWLISLVRFFANWFIWLVAIGVVAAVVADPLTLEYLIGESPQIILGLFLARGVIAIGMHVLISRQRPYTRLEVMRIFVPHGKRAFPSGHATFFSAVAFAILPIAPWAGWMLLVATLINGAARVAGALHWPSDVLMGFLAGYAGIWLGVEIFAAIPVEEVMALL